MRRHPSPSLAAATWPESPTLLANASELLPLVPELQPALRVIAVISASVSIGWNFLIYGLCQFPGCGIFLVVGIFLPP